MSASTSNETKCSATFKNNLQEIKNMIKICVESHSKSFTENAENDFIKKLNLEPQVVAGTINNILGSAENEQICKEGVIKFNQVLEEGFSDNKTFVNSLFPQEKFEYASKDHPIFVPPPYDILKVIYAHTDESFRQKYFHEITQEYYNQLMEMKDTASHIFTKSLYKNQIALLLPLVKMETLFNYKGKDPNFVKELVDDFFAILKFQRLHKEDVFEVIATKIGSTNYKLISYDLESLVDQRGHLGAYYYLHVKIQQSGVEQSFNFFLKFYLRKHPILQTIIDRACSNEAFFYEDLIKRFEEIGLSDVLTFAPKCYLSRERDILVLENVKNLGFDDIPFYSMLPYNALKYVIIQIARYHSCSSILEETLSTAKGRRVNLNELYGNYFQEYFLVSADPNGSFAAFWGTIQFFMDKFADQLPTAPLSISEFKSVARSKAFSTFYRKLKPSSKFRNFLCHGDLYCSNLALKEDDNEEYVDACLLDLQMMRYVPPGHDLLFFIYLNTDRETRQAYMDTLLNDYYEELSRCLNKHGFEPNTVYPKKEFLESIEYSRSQALLQAMMYSQVILAPRNLMKDAFGGPKHGYYLFENRIKFVQRSMVFDVFEKAQLGYITDLYEFCCKEKEKVHECNANLRRSAY